MYELTMTRADYLRQQERDQGRTVHAPSLWRGLDGRVALPSVSAERATA
jgi:hypothetical protein